MLRLQLLKEKKQKYLNIRVLRKGKGSYLFLGETREESLESEGFYKWKESKLWLALKGRIWGEVLQNSQYFELHSMTK